MSYEKLAFGVAEGAVIDVRGNVTALGLNPATWTFESFPAVAPFSVLLQVRWVDEVNDQEPLAGRQTHVAIEVSDPDGKTIFYTAQVVASQPKVVLEVPSSLTLVGQLPIQVEKPGTYTLKVEGRPIDGSENDFSYSMNIYVMEGSAMREAQAKALAVAMARAPQTQLST